MSNFQENIRQKLKAAKSLQLQENSLLFFGFTLLVLIVTVVTLILPGYFDLKEVKANIQDTQAAIDQIDLTIQEKEDELASAEDELLVYQDKYAPRIKKVLPYSEQISELTRFLESFSLELEKKGIMELSTISYGGSKIGTEYNILPVRLSFRANDVNFVHFLQMLNRSGSIEEKDFYDGDPVRLMRIDRISVSIPQFDPNKTQEGIYSVSLEISAFYQNPKDLK